jgi:hypothetical protein
MWHGPTVDVGRSRSTIPLRRFSVHPGAKLGAGPNKLVARALDDANWLMRRETFPRIKALAGIDAPPTFEEV